MNDNKNNMVVSAMNYAIPLGLFWIFKYLFVILGDYSELSKYIVSILSIGTPILFYVLLHHYKDKECEGKIDYGDCILFALLLFLFASFLESAIICLHIFIINPAYTVQFTEHLYQSAKEFSIGNTQNQAEYTKIINGFAANIRSLIIASNILANLILGLFLSLILGYFVSKQSPDQSQKM